MLEISPLYMVIKRVIPSNLEFELSLGRIAKATRNDADCLVVNTFHKYSGLKRPVVILVNVASDCPRRGKNAMYCCATRAMVKLIVLTQEGLIKSFLTLQLLFPMQLKCGLTKREMFRNQKVAF